MKKIVYCGLAVLASIVPAFAAGDPLGEWTVEDGVARVRIVDCNSHLWGVISWEKTFGGLDTENPDKSKRTRPTLGIPILLNMKKSTTEADQWVGKVYNAENGKTYDAKIRPLSADKLELKGCVLGFLCGGQTWTRYIAPPAPTPVPPAPTGVKGKPPQPAPPPPDPSAAICSLPEIAGAAH
jgi:uncharacterized protein (DUF2147 family)